jgi:hypothetical protein
MPSADQTGNSPGCFNVATGLARSLANCFITAGSRLESSRANSSMSKGRSEKPEAGWRQAHLRRIHKRKRRNIVDPTLPFRKHLLELLNVIDVKRFRRAGIRSEILDLHDRYFGAA